VKRADDSLDSGGLWSADTGQRHSYAYHRGEIEEITVFEVSCNTKSIGILHVVPPWCTKRADLLCKMSERADRLCIIDRL
jgi:hypothetical protein